MRCSLKQGDAMKKTGFTLIELMLVVIIISVLVAMVVPRLVGRSQQARVAAAEAQIEAHLATALDLYELDNGMYPATEQGLNSLIIKPSSSPVPPNWKGPYIRKMPMDPWGNPYVYVCPGIHNTGDYDLSSYGADGIESADDIVNWQVNRE
jgi:general secretion pathway protein G